MDKKLLDAINSQINFEIESAFIYYAMKNYFARKSLAGFENWFDVQFKEEMDHAQKFINYLNDLGEVVEISTIPGPANDFKSILEVFETSLAHEKKVTKRINNLMDLANDVSDHATASLLRWYVDEQVEEEKSFSELIDKIKLVKDVGIYMLDKELAARTYVSLLTTNNN
jgi:ferritin